jgi:hypothetical protein
MMGNCLRLIETEPCAAIRYCLHLKQKRPAEPAFPSSFDPSAHIEVVIVSGHTIAAIFIEATCGYRIDQWA